MHSRCALLFEAMRRRMDKWISVIIRLRFSGLSVLFGVSTRHIKSSTLRGPQRIASVDIATEILRVLSASNSLAAKDLYEHLQRVRLCLSRRVSDPPLPPTNDENMPLITDPSIRLPLEHHSPSPVSGASMNYRQLPIEKVADPLSPYLTTEMTLRNPLMQDFLAQSSLNVGSWDHQRYRMTLTRPSFGQAPCAQNDMKAFPERRRVEKGSSVLATPSISRSFSLSFSRS